MNKINVATTITKRSGEKVQFRPYKIALILESLNIEGDVYDAIMTIVMSKATQPNVTTQVIYQTILTQLETLSPKAAESFQSIHIADEQAWLQATNPENKLKSLIN